MVCSLGGGGGWIGNRCPAKGRNLVRGADFCIKSVHPECTHVGPMDTPAGPETLPSPTPTAIPTSLPPLAAEIGFQVQARRVAARHFPVGPLLEGLLVGL